MGRFNMKEVVRVVPVLVAVGLIVTAMPAWCPGALNVYLPDPGQTIDGVYPAHTYDQFYSYSIGALAFWQNHHVDPLDATTPMLLPVEIYGDYSTTSGSGTIPVRIMTGGHDKNDPGFQTSMQTQGGNVIAWEGFWGTGLEVTTTIDKKQVSSTVEFSDDTGPTTVGAVKTLIGGNIPVFAFDFNQAQDILWVAAEVMILSPLDETDPDDYYPNDSNTLASWAFDSLPFYWDGTPPDPVSNGFADPFPGGPGTAGYVPVPQSVFIDGDKYDFDVTFANGQGSYDFLVYSPFLNLSNFDPEDRFVVHIQMAGMDDGFEELGISLVGLVPPPPGPVPEPTALVTWSLLIGAGVASRCWRRRAKAA